MLLFCKEIRIFTRFFQAGKGKKVGYFEWIMLKNPAIVFLIWENFPKMGKFF